MAGDAVGIVSYALDRAEAPSIQDLCHVLGNEPGMTILSCDVDYGSSGAPIFQMIDGEPKIVSVVSAKAEMGGKTFDITDGRIKGSEISFRMDGQSYTGKVNGNVIEGMAKTGDKETRFQATRG